MKRPVLVTLAFVVAAAGVVIAVALSSIDPCRVGDQFIPGCRQLTPMDDRIGLRLTIGGMALLGSARVFLWTSREGSD